jgi:hypothetical protein
VDAASSDQPKLGGRAAWHAVVETVGVRPWWLTGPREPLGRIVDITGGPGALKTGSAALVVGGLAAAALLGWRRRRRDVVAAGALGLVLCAAVAIDTASTPRDSLITLDYTLRWASPAGMCVWVLLGWSVAALALPGGRLSWRRAATVAAFVAVGVAAVAVVAGTSFRTHPYAQQRALNARLVDELPDRGATNFESDALEAATFKSGAMYALRRSRRDVVTVGATAPLGPDYEPGLGYVRTLRIVVAPSPAAPAPGARRLAELGYRAPDGTPRTVTADLLSASRSRGR